MPPKAPPSTILGDPCTLFNIQGDSVYALCCSSIEAAAVAATVGARPGAPPTIPGGPLIAVATSTHGLVEGELMSVEEMGAASEVSSGGWVGGWVGVGGVGVVHT